MGSYTYSSKNKLMQSKNSEEGKAKAKGSEYCATRISKYQNICYNSEWYMWYVVNYVFVCLKLKIITCNYVFTTTCGLKCVSCVHVCMYIATQLQLYTYILEQTSTVYNAVVSDSYVYLLATCFLAFYFDSYSPFKICLSF